VTLLAYAMGTALVFAGGGVGAALASLPMVAVLGLGPLVGGSAIAGTIGRRPPRHPGRPHGAASRV
jgi:dolichol kinase